MSRLSTYTPEYQLEMNVQEITDGALIRAFVSEGDQSAFDTLLRRYYQKMHSRIARKIREDDTAHDLCQTLWMRVLSNLQNYEDDQKFDHYLNTIASNLIKDHWRGDRSSQEASLVDEDGEDLGEFLMDSATQGQSDEESRLMHREAIEALIHHVIPSLSCEQRLVYLLRHESEFWDNKQPFEWQHLAELNGITVNEAGELFEETRDQLVRQGNGGEQVSLSCESNLVFLLWTQARRLNKNTKLTEQYFADLLNMPLNTFKTRYRASVKAIAEGMEKWR